MLQIVPQPRNRRALWWVLGLTLLVSSCQVGTSAPSSPAQNELPSEAPMTVSGFCGTINPDAELATITVGNSLGSLSEAYVAWGEREGCFAKYGLAVDSIPGGGEEKIAALVGGSMDVAAENVVSLAVARANSDIDLRILLGHAEVTEGLLLNAQKNPTLEDGRLILDAALVFSPGSDFERIEDLRGKRISVSQPPSPNTIGLIRALEAASMSLTDVELIPLGGAEGLNALRAGEVDAAVLPGARAYQAIDEGGRLALYPGAYFFEPAVVNGWLTTGTIALHRRDELMAFKSAMLDIYTLLDEEEPRESFLLFLQSEFDFSETAMRQFTLPLLATREVTGEELGYLSRELFRDGYIDREISLGDEILVK